MDTEEIRAIRRTLREYLYDQEDQIDEESIMVIKLAINVLTNEDSLLGIEEGFEQDGIIPIQP